MAFWNMVTIEPKRTFRYLVTFGGALAGSPDAGQISMFATSVSRPKYEVSFKEFQYLNHQFNFPGRVKWQDVTLKFVDAGGSGATGVYKDQNGEKQEIQGGSVMDIARTMMNVLVAGGYTVPDSEPNKLKTLSKTAMYAPVGPVTIKILKPDATGGGYDQIVEEWTLYNSMFGNVSFNDLTYENEDFSTVDLTVKYDYAKIWNGGIGDKAKYLPELA